MVKELLSKGANINARNCMGQTPLLHGIFMNFSLNFNNFSFLCIALIYSYADIELVKELLEKGANTNTADNEGITPLIQGILNANSLNFNNLSFLYS